MRKIRTLAAIAAVAGASMFVAPATVSAGEPISITDAASNAGFTTLVAALEAAQLADMFDNCSAGPYTVFAPTNEAFAAALDALGLTAEQLLANTELLTQILSYHVVSGIVSGATAVTLPGATTVGGEAITFQFANNSLTINGSATVVQADVPACNGTIHVIDAVLVPPSLLPATGSSSSTTSLMVLAGSILALGATGTVLVRRRPATVTVD